MYVCMLTLESIPKLTLIYIYIYIHICVVGRHSYFAVLLSEMVLLGDPLVVWPGLVGKMEPTLR